MSEPEFNDLISVSVPFTSDVLAQTAEFFHSLEEAAIRSENKKEHQIPFKIEVDGKTVHDVVAEVPTPGAATVPEPETEPNPETVFGEGTPVSNVDLDAEGIPWDARIHSAGKTKKKDGIWTAKRQVNTGLVAQVKGELLASTPDPETTTAPAPAPAAAPVTPAPDATVPPAPDTAPQTSEILTFEDFVNAIVKSELPDEKVLPVLTAFGISSLALLASQTDKIPTVAKALGL